MVMKSQETDPTHRLDICIHNNERVGHIGQDPRVERALVHGRVQCKGGAVRVVKRSSLDNEIEALDIVLVDEHLLTGDLEEDISILSIVA